MNNPPYLTTMKGPAGHFAALISWHPTTQAYSVSHTGAARHKTKKKAAREAENWARTAKLEYRP